MMVACQWNTKDIKNIIRILHDTGNMKAYSHLQQVQLSTERGGPFPDLATPVKLSKICLEKTS